MEEFVLYDDYSCFIPDLVPNETKAVIHNQMHTYVGCNYLDILRFRRDSDGKEVSLPWDELRVLYRSDNDENSLESYTMRKEVRKLFGKYWGSFRKVFAS